jgi:uncharacterized protein YndB with AHSA1/START domain
MRRDAPILVLDRIVRAPRHRVWAIWTDPDLLHRWSCPEGMHIPKAAADFQVGGAWEIVMVADHDDSDRHVAFGTYLEITPPERIVQEHQWRRPDGGASPRTVVTVVFQEEGAATRLTLTQTGFDSASARDGHQEGWASTLDRLASLAETGSASAHSG